MAAGRDKPQDFDGELGLDSGEPHQDPEATFNDDKDDD